ncbi:MAG: S46 family peptidase [Bacteroidetes Order II. Incertae sedis bacterium]|nr:S46 family peptidase [Bacteroidetes Order II. bacterium]
METNVKKFFIVLVALLGFTGILQAQSPYADSNKAGMLDGGKMWTFDNPPLTYFRDTYGFNPDAAWFEKARLGALRFATYCSASFVSPNGLVMTNHHCARESLVKVSGGSGMVEKGFVAKMGKEEVKVPDLFVEQLIEIKDVTDRVNAAGSSAANDAARDQAKSQAALQLEKDLSASAGEGRRVQVIRMYSGAKYTAYTFQKYDDIRLVMAPELDIAYFGGDADNFTFPRFNLDMAFFRAYGKDGKPLATPNHFPFSKNGTKAGDAVFTLGNPGTTNRLQTVSILEYRRDIAMPAQVGLFKDGLAVLKKYWDPNDEEKMDEYFGYSNSWKALNGRLAGMRDPVLLDRKRDAEAQMLAAINNSEALKAKYGSLISDIAAIQQQKREQGPYIAGLYGVANGFPFESNLMKRAFLGTTYKTTNNAQLKAALDGLKDENPKMEEELLTIRFAMMEKWLGRDHALVKVAGMTTGVSPAEAARKMLAASKLATSSGFAEEMGGDWAKSSDPAVVLGRALGEAFIAFTGKLGPLNARERELLGQLANAKFGIYGTAIPPDATFSLRISDGVVSSYEYNGTTAAPYTTFYGLMDRYHSMDGKGEWKLPARWQKLPADLDLATPFNFVSTNDIIGGNSGSPLVNTNLEVVGLAFDSNIEGLPGEFIYVNTSNRTVSVDSRAMVESLDKIFDLDRIAQELRTGKYFDTEAAADASMRVGVKQTQKDKKK